MGQGSKRTLIGTVLSRRWRIVQKLGDGGMGEVYVAEPAGLAGERVAVKALRAEFVSDPQVRAHFVEAGMTCTRLIHPNIVRVVECASADDQTPYIVMELLEGVPLGAYTQNGGRVPVAQAVPILHGILAGLAAAHAQGVVHRDLKPENVFLTRHPNGTFVVKVLDFGIAKVMDAAGGMGNRTRGGVPLGTAAYMSPEQVRNTSDVDQRADLWSAGVMLYEMVTGRVAFPAPTEYARLAAVLTSEPEPIEKLDPALAVLASFVRRALRKDRDERFASAIEMARALAAAIPSETARTDGAVGFLPPSAALALSRLPDVPSVFAPSPAAYSQAVSVLADTAPTGPGEEPGRGRQKPGGTLASEPDPRAPLEASGLMGHLRGVPEQLDGTLPSKDLPVLFAPGSRSPKARRSPSRIFAVVVALVAGALLVGFFLGWLFARRTG